MDGYENIKIPTASGTATYASTPTTWPSQAQHSGNTYNFTFYNPSAPIIVPMGDRSLSSLGNHGINLVESDISKSISNIKNHVTQYIDKPESQLKAKQYLEELELELQKETKDQNKIQKIFKKIVGLSKTLAKQLLETTTGALISQYIAPVILSAL